MNRSALLERFFTALISGQRTDARQIVNELLDAEYTAEQITGKLFWPTLEHIQTLHRNDQLSNLAHHYATRLLRSLVDQMQLRLEVKPGRDRKVLVVSGPDEPEELSGQMVADLLEADGYEVHFAGGGIANDEIVAEVGELSADCLVVFGSVAETVPFTRLLIDRLHEIGACPKLQIVVGGGVFNRADGLAEEIGSDLWAKEPHQLVQVMAENPTRRMAADQRTVGRKRRVKKPTAAAA